MHKNTSPSNNYLWLFYEDNNAWTVLHAKVNHQLMLIQVPVFCHSNIARRI